MERVHFESELSALREQIARMGRIAADSVEASMAMFVQRTTNHDSVHKAEEELNDQQRALDDRAFRLVALQQPTARDLRLILGAVRANVDVERVSDHAVNVAHLAAALASRPADVAGESVVLGMADVSLGMFRDAVWAFLEGNTALARDVLARDEIQDREFRSIFPLVMAQMRSTPQTAEVGVQVLLVARNLERIADHATNIAEQAIFIVEAKDVRHGHGE